MGEIVNRVAESGLVQLDLGDYYSPGDRVIFDLKDWLWQEMVIREKEFRSNIKEHDWSQYEGKFVAIACSADAIIPSWAYMLIGIELSKYAAHVCVGDEDQLELELFKNKIDQLDLSQYADARLILKGCSDKNIPQGVFVYFSNLLAQNCKSLMFGEACSSVPVYKKKA